jgi:SAM-dependent methyltransferase
MTDVRTHAWGTQPEMFGPRHEHRLRMILRETAKLPDNALMLDGAVGLGQLSGRMKGQGKRVVGIDYSFDAALHARRTVGMPAVVGDLTRMPFKPRVFDGITSGETLEHLENDAPAVGEFHRVLKEGGTCVVTVPALKVLWSRSDDYYEHRRRYARTALRTMFERNNFVVSKAKFWGFPVVLTYDTLFLLPMNNRRAGREVAKDAALQSVARAGKSRLLVNLVRALFSVDRLFEFIPFGPGLLLVARKP